LLLLHDDHHHDDKIVFFKARNENGNEERKTAVAVAVSEALTTVVPRSFVPCFIEKNDLATSHLPPMALPIMF